MADGEGDGSQSAEPPVVQGCVCGGAEAGGGGAAREVQAGDEGDCGSSPQ